MLMRLMFLRSWVLFSFPDTEKPIMSRRTKATAPGSWLTGLCDCCSDPTLCCTVCLCECNAAGQMFQRTTGYGCLGVSVLLWSLFLISQVLGQTSNALAQAYSREEDNEDLMVSYSVVAGLSGMAALATSIAGTFFVCVSRRRIRQRDRIPEGCCGGCEDCCVAYWCGCCSLIQMLRQESITGGLYHACSPTAV